jgi:hypothetical protein
MRSQQVAQREKTPGEQVFFQDDAGLDAGSISEDVTLDEITGIE